ncbi:MAG: adenylyltransferase/cytidyltransferase family protein, partial [Flavobacteriales bacterium]
MNKKIAVSGCFDLLHSGHVAFLQEASGFGDLFVCIGSDRTVTQLKGRPPINNEEERRYMVQALRCVTGTHINSGSGLLDFIDELRMIRPDMFIVNEDGHSPRKEELCRDFGIEYKVLRRVPSDGLPVRSTTSLRTINTIPFRIDLAGGWLDQPFVSKYASGPVLTISIEPTVEFNHRSGMASSSRNKAIEIWKTSLPAGDPENTARILFSCENPPGTDEVSGSQDALGICLPGLNRLEYEGSYWPERITSVQQEDVLDWLEEHLYLVAIGPRGNDYRVLSDVRVDQEKADRLALHASACWEAILRKDLEEAGRHLRGSFEAQLSMFPKMADERILQFIQDVSHRAAGWKLSGAGGGGYVILLSGQPVNNAIRIR